MTTKRDAIKSTQRILRDARGIETDKKDAPDLTRVKTLGKRHGRLVEKLIREEQDSVIFGRVTEIGQMPVDSRGYTSDVDLFVHDDERFGKKAVKRLGRGFRIKRDTDSERTVIERSHDGEDVLDIHEHPPRYPIGKSNPSNTGKYTGQIQAESKRDLYTKRGLTQEKLYVQTRRKAAATMGKASAYDQSQNGYGPKQHRIKDAYDLLRYTYYLSEQRDAPVEKRKRLVVSANTIRNFFSQPTVYSKFDHGSEFGPRFKNLKSKKRRNSNGNIFSFKRLNRILF